MRVTCRFLFVLLVLAVCIPQTANAQNGPKLVVCGGGSLPDSVFRCFLELAGKQPRLVVIPTASQRDVDLTEVQKLWMSRGFRDVGILHTSDREVASSQEFVAPLKAATAVWFSGGSQQRIADAYLDTLVERELHELLRRGGVVGGTSAGAAIQSRVMIAGGGNEPRLSTGMDLLQGAIVDQHFLKRNRIPRLIAAIRTHPHLTGFGIDEGTALVICNGKSEVVGRSYVLRIESVRGVLRVGAFNDGETVETAVPRVDSSGQIRGVRSLCSGN